jgi:hypothetical protein
MSDRRPPGDTGSGHEQLRSATIARAAPETWPPLKHAATGRVRWKRLWPPGSGHLVSLVRWVGRVGNSECAPTQRAAVERAGQRLKVGGWRPEAWIWK